MPSKPLSLTLLVGCLLALALAGTGLMPPRHAARLAAVGGWQPEFATPGLDGMVRQVLVQPDGSVVAAGAFTFAGPGGQQARTLARWDGQQWLPLGSNPPFGPEGYAFALARTPKGELLVAGRPHGYDTSRPAEVLRFDGQRWQRLGQPSATANVWTLAVLPTGELLAGSGADGHNAGTYRGQLLRWSGSTWQPYAPLPAGTELRQLLVTRKGELLAAGYFPAGAGNPAQPAVARWTGQRWQLLGGVFNGAVYTLAEAPSGSILAGGEFTDAGQQPGADHVARWDGTAWRAMSTGFNGPIRRLLVGAGGEVLANGEFSQVSGSTGYCIARWSQQRWVPLTPGYGGYCKQLLAVLPGGDLLGANNYGGPGPGGYYKDLLRFHADSPPGAEPARVADIAPDRREWRPLVAARTQGLSSDCDLTALAATASGQLAISGYMQLPGTASWQHTVARYDGQQWQALWGLDGRTVQALAFEADGTLLAGGLFPVEKRSGQVELPDAERAARCRYVARWDGQQWQPLGEGPPGPVLALAHTPTGRLLAGGVFGVSAWDGQRWQPLRSDLPAALPGSAAEVPAGLLGATALAVAPSGDIYAANALAERRHAGPASYVAHWDGQAWRPLGEGPGGVVYSIAVAPNGDLLASGNFNQPGASRSSCSVACWNGYEWQYLGEPLPRAAAAVTVLANGTVVLAGTFELPGGNAHAQNLARWNGAAWEPLAGGLNKDAQQLIAIPGGGFAVAGRFTATADSVQSLGHVGVYH